MYLKKLEVQGFKSFADKTVLEFKPGITAIIGPNGSGKSNVSDAIRWVLGEQSIKTLRGSKLEDVIFAGTQARKSVSYAEVDITIDNSDGKLPIEYSEVTITRRVYRSGESEFFINKNQRRLKDIVELFMDTGIGRDGYSIIGQGRIDEILSTKSEERRKIFEDAAGIVKYRTRKEEAEKKLENTVQNLIRINDIVSELESQLGPLKEQSEKAKKFLEIREQLKYLEVGLFISNINKGKTKLDETIVALTEITTQASDEEAKLKELQFLKEEIRKNLDELTSNVEEIQRNVFEAQNNIEKQKGDIGVFNERIAHNKEDYEKFALEIEDYENKKIEFEQEKEERAQKRGRLAEDKKRFETELAEKEEEYRKLSENLTNEQKKIEEIKDKIMSNMDLKFEKMEILSDLSANVEANSRRVVQIGNEIDDNIHELDKEKMQKEDEQIELSKVTKSKNELQEKIEKFSKIKSESNQKILEYENRIRGMLSEISNKESRHKFLVETESEFEGYNRAVKEVMTKSKKDKQFGKNICGTLANLITVPSEYETAIELSLGGTIQNIVTETENDAKDAISYLKANNLGRASFFPITAIKADKLKQNLKDTDGVIGIAADLISFDKKYEQIINSVLGKTVIVDNMDNAVKLAQKFKYGFKIVTLDGDIVNPSGQMTGGSVFKKTTSILSRAREITELEGIIKNLKSEHEKVAKELEQYKESVETAINEFEDTERRLQEISISFATETEKMTAIENNITRINKKLELLRAEKEKLEEQTGKSKQDIEGINSTIENAERENEESQAIVKEFADKNAEQQKVIDDLNSDIMDLRISVSSFDESATSINEMMERIERDIENCVTNIERRKEARERILQENDGMSENITKSNESIENIKIEICKFEEEVSKIKEKREEKNDKLIQTEKEIEDKFKTLDILREQSMKLDLKKSKIEMDIETIQNKMWEDYETTPNTARNYAEVTPGTAKEVEKCKSEIKALGNININSIEEYKAVGERYEFLSEQKKDLETSQNDLNKIIEDMVEVMKLQFAQNFEVINKNFEEVFVELFGGGYATLRLADENNLLESGIEIEVQPPGKKLQNMMLLSGGERALTAIALLFAILKLSPSPFCILDEIEAALDDVNVYRYAEYLKKFSKETQFLIITHRKGTMEAANTIYGATMQEHGITKLISMQLGEAN